LLNSNRFSFFFYRFTLYYGTPPSPSYHGSFHQWFTLCYGTPPSPSYHGSFLQRFTFCINYICNYIYNY
ncbi:hypothetical protein Taro_008224, partial [Colocasia esculenta]|nr:hypothetical protein [Colocasia esculenta]